MDILRDIYLYVLKAIIYCKCLYCNNKLKSLHIHDRIRGVYDQKILTLEVTLDCKIGVLQLRKKRRI